MRLIEWIVFGIVGLGVLFYFIHGISSNGHPLSQLVAVTSSPGAKCHYNGPLPDQACTPGAVNPDITQDNIGQTICNPSWHTSSIRPPVSYTDSLKKEQLVEYGASDQNPSHFEEDHLIPLEVGGNPSNPKNLWPEPRTGSPNSFNKDHFENFLHHQVCQGSINLQQAQEEISTDWVKYWQAAGSP